MYLRVLNKVGFWGFGPLWLTFADDYPQNIEIDKLDADTRNAVKAALANGVLIEVDRSGSVVSHTTAPASKVQVAIVKDAPSDIDIPAYFKPKVDDLLKNGVTALRREIALLRNSQFISYAIEAERKSKNRKTVLSLLESQLQKNGSISKAHNMYDALVKDEDIEEIQIKRADMLIIESKEEVKELEVEDLEE